MSIPVRPSAQDEPKLSHPPPAETDVGNRSTQLSRPDSSQPKDPKSLSDESSPTPPVPNTSNNPSKHPQSTSTSPNILNNPLDANFDQQEQTNGIMGHGLQGFSSPLSSPGSALSFPTNTDTSASSTPVALKTQGCIKLSPVPSSKKSLKGSKTIHPSKLAEESDLIKDTESHWLTNPPETSWPLESTGTGWPTMAPAKRKISGSNIGKKRSHTDGDDADIEVTPAKKVTKRAPAKQKAAAASVKPKAPAKAKAVAPPPKPSATSSRPSRTRKAPARFAEEQPKEIERKKAAPKSTGAGSKVFDPVYITTNANSRLVKADIYHMILEAAAWDSLSADDQQDLLLMLPKTSANMSLRARFAAGATNVARPKELQASDLFRTDVAKFQTDLGAGQLAKGWQAAADQAMKDRAEGLFDEWKAEETEAWWGQKSD